ncbi:MAG: mismatch-specific DNA-glycosylase [Pseudomonadota bacterium]
MPTLPDYIDSQLKVLSVGLNPSIPSVEKGYYFANPRNRFWPAFNQSDILDHSLTPDSNVHKRLLEEYRIGFTDVVKRPSRMANQLKSSDYRQDAPLLRKKIELYLPQLIWFHGKLAIKYFMQYGYGVKNNWQWGMNQVPQLNSKVFVTPNPSPANASYSLQVLIDFYNQLPYREL